MTTELDKLESFLSRIESLAFEIPAPNTVTPRIVGACVELRAHLTAQRAMAGDKGAALEIFRQGETQECRKQDGRIGDLFWFTYADQKKIRAALSSQSVPLEEGDLTVAYMYGFEQGKDAKGVPVEVVENMYDALRSCQIQSGYCHESGGEVGEYWYDDDKVNKALALAAPYVNGGG